MSSPRNYGEGITGWAAQRREPVRTNRAHLDPRVKVVPGTPPDEPEALITVPLVARGSLKGALNIYRLGERRRYDGEFELARRFGDAAALALDNAEIRARLEHEAQTDSLTGLYNHRFFHERLRAELGRATRAARPGRGADGRRRRLQARQRRLRPRRRRQRPRELAGLVARGRPRLRRRLPHRRRGVRGDHALLRRRRTRPRAPARRTSSRRTSSTAGRVTVSIGIAEGPQHASNPRELVACAEAAMMTAKARGGTCSSSSTRRRASGPTSRPLGRDVRSIAHLKMLQSVAGKLNRLNDVREIGETIADELRLLIEYHNCRVYLREGDELRSDRLPRRARARRSAGTRRSPAEVGRASRPGGGDRRAAPRRRRARVRVQRSRSPAPRITSRSSPSRSATARA